MAMFAAVPYVYREDEEEERKIMHYSSFHHILLVGDGDFSFSLCLARAFGDGSFIVATSLDSYDMLMKKYKQAHSNIQNLNSLGARVLHGVDVKEMKLHVDLRVRKFDRIIFNFPHAGFYGKEDNSELIKMHSNIVKEFFRNASGMLRFYGEIHVNHKTTAPFRHWNIEELAKESSLLLIDCVEFKKEDYPGYNNKRGDGKRSDEPFPLKECSTYKFILRKNTAPRKPLQAPDKNIPVTFLKVPICVEDEISGIFSDYFDHVIATFGRPSYIVYYLTRERLRNGFERYEKEEGGRDLDGYIRLLHELQLFHFSKMAKLGIMLNSDYQLGAKRVLDDIFHQVRGVYGFGSG